MNHVTRSRLLHGLTVYAERLPHFCHRIAIKLLRYDPRSHGCERIMSFADEPVGPQGIATGRATASIRDIHGDGITKYIGFSIFRRYILGRPTDNRAQFHFPVRSVATIWDENPLIKINGA